MLTNRVDKRLQPVPVASAMIAPAAIPQASRSVVLQIFLLVGVDSLPDEPAVAHIPGEPVE